MPTGDFNYNSSVNCLGCMGNRCTCCLYRPTYYYPLQYQYYQPIVKKEIIEKFDDKGNVIERITREI